MWANRQQIGSRSIAGCGSTNIKIVNYKYIWTIRNFSFCPRTIGKVLKSPKFPDADTDDIKWNLFMYPKGSSPVAMDYVSIYLVLCDPSKITGDSLRVKFRISILNGKLEETNAKESKHPVQFLVSSNKNKFSGFPYFIRNDMLQRKRNDLLKNDTLTICCEIYASSDIETVSNEITTPNLLLPNDLESLFENPEFSDVTVSANGKDFKVHKAILAARSSVFKAMFNTDMMENQNRRVEITDLDVEVLEKLLRFIYTGNVSNFEDSAEDLLKAADKYALLRLKVICEEELVSKLSITNVCYMFTFADLHGADELKKQSKQFILCQLFDVANTTEWKTMVLEYPHLAIEVLATQ